MMECDWAIAESEGDSWEGVYQAKELRERAGPWLLPVYYEGQEWQARLDSGSSVSMIRSTLLPTQLPVIRVVNIACFHGHSEACPVVELTLYYGGQPRCLQVARVQQLPYPVLLGRDAPAFHQGDVNVCPARNRSGSPSPQQPRSVPTGDPLEEVSPTLIRIQQDPAHL